MENKIIITKNAIIKVRNIEKGVIIGYNVLNEELVEVPNNGYMEITQEIISLLGNEENRLRLASSLFLNSKDICKTLNVTDRTLFRLEKKYVNQEGRKVNNNSLNLNKEQIDEIRKLNSSGKYSQIYIGNQFNISSQSVSNICLRKGKYKNI